VPTLILLLLLLWVVVTLVLSLWTLLVQGYLYTETTTGVAWRGPAAGGAVVAIVVLWVMLDYHSPGNYRTLFEFSSTEASPPFRELRVPAGGREEVYRLRPGTRNEYRLNGLPRGNRLPTRPGKIIVYEDKEKSVFEPERDSEGHFKQRSTSSWFGGTQLEPLRYVDEKGRVMLETSLGQLTAFRGGRFAGNIFLNVLFAGVVFVAMWLLLRFQWPHALGQALVFCAVVLLFVIPPLLTRAEEVSVKRNPPARKE